MSELKKLIENRASLIKSIKVAEVKIKETGASIAKLSPFNVGDVLVVNDWSHDGKDFLCENITVTTAPKSAIRERIDGNLYFKAEGRLILKDGKLGKLRGQRAEKVEDYI